jgi:hypothetical protein
MHVTDQKSISREHPAQFIHAEERCSTSDKRLDENAGEPHPAA